VHGRHDGIDAIADRGGVTRERDDLGGARSVRQQDEQALHRRAADVEADDGAPGRGDGG